MTEIRAGPVLCFGEILWDSLPRGLFPGGAPFNVAYHLCRLGVRALPVSAVGNDVLGEELLRRMKAAGIETSMVGTVPGKSTGLVRAIVRNGIPEYDIVRDVAWDRIDPPPALEAVAPGVLALVFGSLAQRSDHNRRVLRRLREQCSRALQVFDVNLRPPFDDLELVLDLAAGADVLKLNDEELARLDGSTTGDGNLDPAARRLAGRTGCPTICVTAGAAGAGLLHDDRWHWAAAMPVRVRDTIGAGDAFLAVLIQGLLGPRVLPEGLLDRAHRLAGFVASSDGATPAYHIGAGGEIVPESS